MAETSYKKDINDHVIETIVPDPTPQPSEIIKNLGSKEQAIKKIDMELKNCDESIQKGQDIINIYTDKKSLLQAKKDKINLL